MNQQEIEQFKADFRQIVGMRLERPIEQINARLGRIEELLRRMDDRLEKLENNPPYMTGRPE